jgi:hypothetical protein
MIISYMSAGHVMAQDKWHHGFSVGIGYTDFIEDHQTATDSDRYSFETLLKSSFRIWNQYSFSDKIRANVSAGFGWKGARLNAEQVDYDGVYFIIPSYIEYQLVEGFAMGAGIEYSYLISLGESSDREVYNLTSEVSNKHLVASLVNLRVILAHNVSINLEYNYGLNEFFQFSRFNTMGGFRETVNLRNRGIQISFTFHT